MACWIALENVLPGSGPLRLYAGSHLIDPFVFSGGTYHAKPREFPQWAAYMQGELDRRRLVPEILCIPMGDAILWHADTVHGAEPITNPGLTRKSLVGHYLRFADARKRGYTIERAPSGGLWIMRRPQPVDLVTRFLSAGERRVQNVRGILRPPFGR